MLNDVDRWDGQTVSAHYQQLHKRPGIQSRAVAAVFTTDTAMDTSLRDRLVGTRAPNNVESGGETAASTSFNIRDNKRNVEWLLKQVLHA